MGLMSFQARKRQQPSVRHGAQLHGGPSSQRAAHSEEAPVTAEGRILLAAPHQSTSGLFLAAAAIADAEGQHGEQQRADPAVQSSKRELLSRGRLACCGLLPGMGLLPDEALLPGMGLLL